MSTPYEKFRATMIQKHGSWDAFLFYQRTIASKGGKNSKGGGFEYLKRTGQVDKLKAISVKGGHAKKGSKHVASSDRSQRAEGTRTVSPFEGDSSL